MACSKTPSAASRSIPMARCGSAPVTPACRVSTGGNSKRSPSPRTGSRTTTSGAFTAIRAAIHWFGTGSGGVARFDGTNWSTLSEVGGLSGDAVNAIQEDSGGQLVVRHLERPDPLQPAAPAGHARRPSPVQTDKEYPDGAAVPPVTRGGLVNFKFAVADFKGSAASRLFTWKILQRVLRIGKPCSPPKAGPSRPKRRNSNGARAPSSRATTPSLSGSSTATGTTRRRRWPQSACCRRGI